MNSSDWSLFLGSFHASRPGITEAVLVHATIDGRDPYDWLAEPVSAGSAVLDLGCGSAPSLPRLPATSWVGVDASANELAVAAARGTAALAQARAASLPVRTGTIDVVVSAMALHVIQPMAATLAEIARVLRPGGFLIATIPTTTPLSVMDRVRYGRLIAALRHGLGYPNDRLLRDLSTALDAAGLRLVSDERRRFAYPIITHAAAELFVDSLYLPRATVERVVRAKQLMSGWVGHDLGIPVRRIIAEQHEAGRLPAV